MTDSLLRCTVKKSVDVSRKLAIVAVTLIGVFAAAYILERVTGAMIRNIASALEPLAGLILSAIFNLAGMGWSALLGIPWYCYAGMAAILAIPVYSLLWCVAREFTDEDWKSKEAEDIAILIVILIVSALTYVLCTAALFIAVGFYLEDPAFYEDTRVQVYISILSLIIAFPLTIPTVSLFHLSVDINSSGILTFPGAYLHYRRGINR